jgi:hypothetical protein
LNLFTFTEISLPTKPTVRLKKVTTSDSEVPLSSDWISEHIGCCGYIIDSWDDAHEVCRMSPYSEVRGYWYKYRV